MVTAIGIKSPASLIVGARGLLGSAIARQIGPLALHAQIRWGSSYTSTDLKASILSMLASSGDEPWRLYWCAGAGVVGTSEQDLAAEVSQFEIFLDLLTKLTVGRPGTLFLSSSAGGLLAGSLAPRPLTEKASPAPLSPYGFTKLSMESKASEKLDGTQICLAIGRIANLYGPGQDLDKVQGIISQLGKALVTGEPFGLYVPMRTIRDYIYVDDCAAMIVGFVQTVEAQRLSKEVKIIASGRGVSIGELIDLIEAIAHRKPPIIHSPSELAAVQSTDLRLQSIALPELNTYATTPLEIGISTTLEEIFRALH